MRAQSFIIRHGSPSRSRAVIAGHRSMAIIMGAPIAPSLLRRHDGC
jgi:hypothetical protein